MSVNNSHQEKLIDFTGWWQENMEVFKWWHSLKWKYSQRFTDNEQFAPNRDYHTKLRLTICNLRYHCLSLYGDTSGNMVYPVFPEMGVHSSIRHCSIHQKIPLLHLNLNFLSRFACCTHELLRIKHYADGTSWSCEPSKKVLNFSEMKWSLTKNVYAELISGHKWYRKCSYRSFGGYLHRQQASYS